MYTALDVAIGLIFVYLTLALVVTTLQELIASAFRWRAKDLYQTVEDMLGDDGKAVAEALYRHPLIANLAQGPVTKGRELRAKFYPSYIPSKTFALALLDVLGREKTATQVVGLDTVLENADGLAAKLPEGALKSTLALLLNDVKKAGLTANAQAALVSERVESWFNDRMARASGWYKRRMQLFSLGLAGAVTVVFNADTLHLATRLWNDAALRQSIVLAAQQLQNAGPAPADAAVSDLGTRLTSQSQSLLSAGLPLGWSHANVEALTLVGWCVTALMVSLGAGFWFDVLSKALQLRGSGAKVSATTGEIERKNDP
jgi:hypothetical protein